MMIFLCGWLPLAAYGADQAAGTRIDLDATAKMHLANDEVVISFRIEREGRDGAAVRQYVNRVSGEIHRQLAQKKRQKTDLKLKTTNRSMQPLWQYPKNRQRQRTGWRMVQSEQLISSRLEQVPGWLDLIEKAGGNLSAMKFRVSASAMEKAQAELRLEAIAAFRKKAAVIAKGLDAHQFRVIRLQTSSAIPQPVLYRAEMAMMAKSADAPPSLAAGEGVVRVSVNGTIETPFTDFPVR